MDALLVFVFYTFHHYRRGPIVEDSNFIYLFVYVILAREIVLIFFYRFNFIWLYSKRSKNDYWISSYIDKKKNGAFFILVAKLGLFRLYLIWWKFLFSWEIFLIIWWIYSMFGCKWKIFNQIREYYLMKFTCTRPSNSLALKHCPTRKLTCIIAQWNLIKGFKYNTKILQGSEQAEWNSNDLKFNV